MSQLKNNHFVLQCVAIPNLKKMEPNVNNVQQLLDHYAHQKHQPQIHKDNLQT